MFILEDTNGDGQADTSTVFAGGLNIPLGFELGHNGVYMGEQTEMIFLEDTDNDDRADKRTVLFSGFGTGDLHQTLNSFTWSPGGDLYFAQGHNIYSRVETPWGIKGANRAGIWRYSPVTGKLDNFFNWSTASVNPWGMAFDDWGGMFHKANDPPLYYSVPGLIENDAQRSYLPEIGSLVIKGSGLVIVRSSHMPADLHGDFVIAGYYNNRIERMKVSEDSSGYKARLVDPIVTSSSRSFRPIEVNTGPDGAIYVLDWYDPIIGHYQASLRHPDRDKLNGRIWRITAKKNPLLKRPELDRQPPEVLLDQLKSKEYWPRYQAKRLLAQLPSAKVIPAVDQWLLSLNQTEAAFEHHLMEAIGVYESHNEVRENWLNRLVQAKQPGARTYAALVLAKWHDRLTDPVSMLRVLANDRQPRVRLNAVVAASYIQSPESVSTVVQVFDHPADKFIQYAWDKTAASLRPVWETALKKNSLRFKKQSHLARLIHLDPPAWYAPDKLKLLVQLKELPAAIKANLVLSLAKTGDSSQLSYVLQQAAMLGEPSLYARLAELSPATVPTVGAAQIVRLINSAKNPVLVTALMKLAGHWNLRESAPAISKWVKNQSADIIIRSEAIKALAIIEGAASVPLLKQQAADDHALPEIRLAALKSLCRFDLNAAVDMMFGELNRAGISSEQIKSIVTPVFEQQGGLALVESSLPQQEITGPKATMLLHTLSVMGIESPAIRQHLNAIAGKKTGIPAGYNNDYIARLVKEVKEKGDTARGRLVLQSNTACFSCHAINGKGGNIGPNLSALGRGLSPAEIAVELLWPAQNIKEGYNRVTVETTSNETFQGNKQGEDRESVTIRTASGKTIRFEKITLKRVQENGSLMPAGLLDGTDEADLRDLVKYLSSLGLENN